MIRLRKAWVVLVALAASGYAIVAFDWAAVVAALAALPVGSVLAVTVGATLVTFGLCAVRWTAVNSLPFRRDAFLRVYAYVSVVTGVAIATPMQVGEVLKVKFARDAGLPTGGAAVNLMLERLLDVAFVGALALAGLIQAGGGSPALSLGALGAIGGGAVLAPAFLHGAADHLRRTRLGARLVPALGPRLSWRSVVFVGLATIAKWGLTVVAWALLLRAAGIHLAAFDAMLLVGGVTLLSVASAVPGGIGVQEVSARALLMSFGVEAGAAEAGAVVLRVFTPVMILLGLAHLLLLRPALNLPPAPSPEHSPHG